MDEPLVVPGHPIDNPPTDDYWPRLTPRLDPEFTPDDGTPAGPYQAKDAKWFAMTSEPHELNDSVLIRDPLVAITDSRVVVLGPIGAAGPPDRRLVTQFNFVCLMTLEWDFGKALSPSMLILSGLLAGSPPTGVSLVLRFSKTTDARLLTQDILHRAARQFLRLDFVDPDGRISARETHKDYVGGLAHATIHKSERAATVPFPRFRMIRHGEDFRARGPNIQSSLVDANLSET
ncbi:hypothetical protein G6009_11250 [Dietzia sp. SLG510A3-30A2]|nr:hypothetical protein [Dietzia sp. SLG510A3-30A2]